MLAATVVLLALAACSPDASMDTGTNQAWVDLRVDAPEPPEFGYQMASPTMQIPAYHEANLCYFGTYDGPDVGVVSQTVYSHREITHHTAAMGVYDDLYGDGETVDCLVQGVGGMPVYSSIFEAVGFEMEGGEPAESDPLNGLEWVQLPPGVAFKLDQGQRWTLDLHYINAYDQPARTNTLYNLGFVDASEVEHWVAPVMFDAGSMDLPVGDSTTVFSCEWEQGVTVLSLMGHMHSFGSAFKVEWVKADGSSQVIYEIAEWTPDFKDWPRLSAYEDGEIVVDPGDSFRTTCSWSNPTGEILPDPAEMCTTNLVAYPLEKPLTCIDGVYYDN